MNYFQSSTGGNPALIRPGYELNGTPHSTAYASSSFIGPATAGAMIDTSYQGFLNSLFEWNALNPAGGYYDAELQLIPMIVASGNWWQP